MVLSSRNTYSGTTRICWSRSLPDPAGGVIVRAVTWAEPTIEIALIAQGDAAKMGANANHDEPFLALDTLGIGLRVPQIVHRDRLGLGDLLLRAVTDEYRLAAPDDGHDLTRLNRRQVDLRRRHRKRVRRRIQTIDQGPGKGGSTNRCAGARSQDQKIPTRLPLFLLGMTARRRRVRHLANLSSISHHTARRKKLYPMEMPGWSSNQPLRRDVAGPPWLTGL